MRDANVIGTRNVLEFAVHFRRKNLIYISSTSVLDRCDDVNENLLGEAVSTSVVCMNGNGYAKSKWVAERMVGHAFRAGLDGFVVRPDSISGSTTTGACNPKDFLARFLVGVAEMKCAPDSPDIFAMVPVDVVSGMIVGLGFAGDREGRRVYHMYNGDAPSVRDLGKWIRSDGFEIELESYVMWRKKLLDAEDGENGNALTPLKTYFANAISHFPASRTISCENTRAIFIQKDGYFKTITKKNVFAMIKFLIDKGILHKPQS
eukprot:TRINITY_DN5953_c0_g1_i1.p1 TRINITY_DN5953_c0_g1~~TRINITY_DN5953_c0_g1_i1.p1  ORF type:complete len:262 (+),score=35.21 TRINITY_DN5953_c0_g1_i1:528-1313(+)